jgi:outer membrane porin, OprD family
MMTPVADSRSNNVKLRLFFLVIVLLCGTPVHKLLAQNKDSITALSKNYKKDSATLLGAFAKGKLEGRFRYFFMSTINEDSLTDYFANAVGGAIKYETAPFHRFQFGMGGFFTFNIWSSDLSKPDPHTNISNRYEIGLFDVTNPSNKKDLNKLEYLYLKYNLNKGYITLGKQLLNTPFINAEDGRMRPTEEDGVYAQIHKTKIIWEGGWLYNMSPRSTIKWFTVASSLGIYSKGLNPDGTPSNYGGNLSSKGIGMFGATYFINKKWNARIWEQYVDNIFNVWMLQAEYKNDRASKNFFAGLRFIGENAVNDGGNPDPQKTYMLKGASSFVISTRAGIQFHKWEMSINYSRITKQGRFLSPREWGIEPLYTFMYRERNEGAGDVQAFMWKLKNSALKTNLISEISLGYYSMPDVKNYTLNKYGMPSYAHLDFDVKYFFSKSLKGFDAEFLYALKKCTGDHYDNSKYVINKVNLSHLSFIINYKFSQ